ncbi:MAG: hypothetical protein Q9184_001848 [Pyrenodesmia sp. 2 TL-2023]
MAQVELTLSEYLRHANPQIERDQCRKGSNTRSLKGRTPFEQPNDIKEWDDFGLSALDAVCGGALSPQLTRRYLLNKHPVLPRLPFCEIHDEDSLECLLGLWSWQVVSNALAAVQKDSLRHPSGDSVYMVRGGQAYHPGGGVKKAEGLKEDRPTRPDWAGIRRPGQDSLVLQISSKHKTILPGDTKLSSKWTSHKIPPVLPPAFSTQDWYQPIGQLYKYCTKSNARYGYLITDYELVVFRIDLVNTDGKERVIIRYKSIPWKSEIHAALEDPEHMTVNLALWLLHLAAAWDGKLAADEQTLKARLGQPVKTNPRASERIRNQTPTTSARTVSEDWTTTQTQNASFRSETSCIRARFSGTSLDNEEGEASQSSSGQVRKRELEAVCLTWLAFHPDYTRLEEAISTNTKSIAAINAFNENDSLIAKVARYLRLPEQGEGDKDGEEKKSLLGRGFLARFTRISLAKLPQLKAYFHYTRTITGVCHACLIDYFVKPGPSTRYSLYSFDHVGTFRPLATSFAGCGNISPPWGEFHYHPLLKGLFSLTSAASRPETEAWTTHLAYRVLCNSVLNFRAPDAPLRVLDLCAGTGCISLLLHALLHRAHPSLEILGVDISHIAVKLARHNLGHNVGKSLLSSSASSQIGFVTGDVFKSHGIWANKQWDIVISNPPYILPAGFDRTTTRSVRNWEPKMALVPSVTPENAFSALGAHTKDNDVGDIFYPRILRIALEAKAKMVVMEVGDMAQAERVAEMLLNGHGWKRCEILKDAVTTRSEELETKKLGGQKVAVKGEGNGRVVVAWRN